MDTTAYKNFDELWTINMIKVELRNGNQIVNLTTDGKVPIRSRSGSYHFHTPIELLCCALGACVGKYVLRFCSWENVNLQEFESVEIDIDSFKPLITIRHTEEVKEDKLLILRRTLEGCEIASMLKDKPTIRFEISLIPREELIKPKKSGCCGD